METDDGLLEDRAIESQNKRVLATFSPCTRRLELRPLGPIWARVSEEASRDSIVSGTSIVANASLSLADDYAAGEWDEPDANAHVRGRHGLPPTGLWRAGGSPCR